MGNCLFGGMGEVDKAIKVITSNGGIMEFYPPITASCIIDEFPCHSIYPSHDIFWKPLSNHEELVAGESYYLLPLNSCSSNLSQIVRQGHIRSNSIPTSLVTSYSYRMSFDYQGMIKKRSYTEAFSSSSSSRYSTNSSNGFWKVKLVISPEQLLEILSQEGRTLELIESVRTVAKCGNNGVSSSSSSVAFSDQWSLSSSSINASS